MFELLLTPASAAVELSPPFQMPAAAPFDLYPRSRAPKLDEALFARPTAEYRGAPFWAWNCDLELPRLVRQIGVFQQMGFGGANLHARSGLRTPYLGDDFMQLIRACTDELGRRGMLAWLYDEDRWPSGYAGGLATEDIRFRARHLLWTCRPYAADIAQRGPGKDVINDGFATNASASRMENGHLLGRYEVVLDAEGNLADYALLAEGQTCARGGVEWLAYLETGTPSPWYNGQTYLDTLNPAAVRHFLKITYERYAEVVGTEFGGIIPAIFTDEPEYTFVGAMREPADRRDCAVPWTDDFAATYAEAFGGEDVFDFLPELFWEQPAGGRPARVRYRYQEHLTARFAEAFAGETGAWCEQHGLALTGHMMEEPTLFSQYRAVGEAMRSLARFQIPGIDMLGARREYTTAKQAQSVAHQYGRTGVLSELYGVTGWHFPFSGHKQYGDWQAALGVTVRVPHLAWVSMAGESKRDYPASIGEQSPWWAEYALVEDHFARVNVALTRGRPLVRIGVIHPIESYGLVAGPMEQTAARRQQEDRQFEELTDWLLSNTLDFDYISESLLPGQCPAGAEMTGTAFPVGEMRYEAVVVPVLRTIRATTLDRLERFAAAGGCVIFAGDPPELVDADPSDRAQRLAADSCRRVPWAAGEIVAALAPFRDVTCTRADGRLLYQLRIDGDARQLFLVNTDRDRDRLNVLVRLRGRWQVTERDTLTGELRPHPAAADAAGGTIFVHDFHVSGSLLATLEPLPPPPSSPASEKIMAGTPSERQIREQPPVIWRELGRLPDPVPVTLAEPNVLLLSHAEWRWIAQGSGFGGDDGAEAGTRESGTDAPDPGEWQPAEELLRVSNLARACAGLPPRSGADVQPWVEAGKPAPVLGTLACRMRIDSAVSVAGAFLGLEEPHSTRIYFDGQPVDSGSRRNAPANWWVDESIAKVPLPDFGAGEHVLELRRPFTRETQVEWCYLLGDFGVTLRGRHARLTEPVRSLCWGDWTSQGLPFYAGNLTYHAGLTVAPMAAAVEGSSMAEAVRTTGDRPVCLQVASFANPLLTVDTAAGGGERLGAIAFPPYRLELGGRIAGEEEQQPQQQRQLDITAYGDRHNAFGPIFNSDPNLEWIGPTAWRSQGAHWTDEPLLRPMGILTAPRLVTSALQHSSTPVG